MSRVVTQLCKLNNLDISAYKSENTSFSSEPIVHMVIQTRDKKVYEHMIPLEQLEIDGYKMLEILLYFNKTLDTNDFKLVKQALVTFAYNGDITEDRFTGFNTQEIYEYLIKRLEKDDVIKEDDDFIYVGINNVNRILKNGEKLYIGSSGGAIARLMDGYILYDNKSGHEWILIRKNIKQLDNSREG